MIITYIELNLILDLDFSEIRYLKYHTKMLYDLNLTNIFG